MKKVVIYWLMCAIMIIGGANLAVAEESSYHNVVCLDDNGQYQAFIIPIPNSITEKRDLNAYVNDFCRSLGMNRREG